MPLELSARVPDAGTVGREVVKALPAPATGHGMALGRGPVVILPDDAGVAEALAMGLAAAGHDARVGTDVADAAAVVCLGGLRATATGTRRSP